MPTDNERLDRIEQILEITLTLGQQFREDLIQIDQMTKRNASAITQLEEKVTQFVKQSIQDRETVTYEFRGLRLEMQRLIELTLGENNSAIADVDKQQQEFVETQKSSETQFLMVFLSEQEDETLKSNWNSARYWIKKEIMNSERNLLRNKFIERYQRPI